MDKSIIKDIVRLLVLNGHEFRQMLEADHDLSLRMRSFFGLCLAHGDAGEEAIIHAYTFLFWDEVAREVSLGRKMHSIPRWTSREFGIGIEQLPADEQQLCQKIINAGVEIDLFSCDSKTQTLALIEIKRGECDDRAVGQLLRYYQKVWKLLPSSEFRKLNLNYVWPILIVNRIKEPQLSALPVHFLGMLDILTYETTDGVPAFKSYRPALITSRWV